MKQLESFERASTRCRMTKVEYESKISMSEEIREEKEEDVGGDQLACLKYFLFFRLIMLFLMLNYELIFKTLC